MPNMREKWYGMKPEKMDLLRCHGVTYLRERCIFTATVTHEDKPYCASHYPPEVARKQKLNKDPRCKGPSSTAT